MSDLICFSHLRWDFVWQRPQHVLSRMAKHYRILFVEEPITTSKESKPRLEILPAKGATNISVARLIFPVEQEHRIGHGDALTQETYSRLLNVYLKAQGFKDPLLWLYTPMASAFTETIPHRLLACDVMEQLSAVKDAPAQLVEKERRILRQADIVFTGGVSLYRSKLPFNANTYLFPSGVEIEHFAQATDSSAFPIPDDIANVPRPILGYYGVIDERMDLGLIAQLAQAHPEWSVVMLGPLAKISPEDLPQAPNIYYPGMKTYEQLPSYLAHFDVALVPFARNEATKYLSPTKTLEYMAAHKPIVSTPINDVVESFGEVVRIGDTSEEFIQHVEAALTDNPEARRVKEDQLLNLYTWDSLVQRMKRLIDRCYRIPTTKVADGKTAAASTTAATANTGAEASV
jgi:UDP-galactopyranose mutase